MSYLKFHSIFVFFLILSFKTCKQLPIEEASSLQKQEQIENTVVFQDKDRLFQIELEKNYEYQFLDRNTEKHYYFEWFNNLQGNKKSLYQLEIRIFSRESNLYENVLQPSYEINFLKNCKCNIIQKSWILIQKVNAREYEYQMNTFTFLSLHFVYKDFLIQIQASSENYALLSNFWKKLKQTISLGE